MNTEYEGTFDRWKDLESDLHPLPPEFRPEEEYVGNNLSLIRQYQEPAVAYRWKVAAKQLRPSGASSPRFTFVGWDWTLWATLGSIFVKFSLNFRPSDSCPKGRKYIAFQLKVVNKNGDCSPKFRGYCTLEKRDMKLESGPIRFDDLKFQDSSLVSDPIFNWDDFVFEFVLRHFPIDELCEEESHARKVLCKSIRREAKDLGTEQFYEQESVARNVLDQSHNVETVNLLKNELCEHEIIVRKELDDSLKIEIDFLGDEVTAAHVVGRFWNEALLQHCLLEQTLLNEVIGQLYMESKDRAMIMQHQQDRFNLQDDERRAREELNAGLDEERLHLKEIENVQWIEAKKKSKARQLCWKEARGRVVLEEIFRNEGEEVSSRTVLADLFFKEWQLLMEAEKTERMAHIRQDTEELIKLDFVFRDEEFRAVPKQQGREDFRKFLSPRKPQSPIRSSNP